MADWLILLIRFALRVGFHFGYSHFSNHNDVFLFDTIFMADHYYADGKCASVDISMNDGINDNSNSSVWEICICKKKTKTE